MEGAATPPAGPPNQNADGQDQQQDQDDDNNAPAGPQVIPLNQTTP